MVLCKLIIVPVVVANLHVAVDHTLCDGAMHPPLLYIVVHLHAASMDNFQSAPGCRRPGCLHFLHSCLLVSSDPITLAALLFKPKSQNTLSTPHARLAIHAISSMLSTARFLRQQRAALNALLTPHRTTPHQVTSTRINPHHTHHDAPACRGPSCCNECM